MDRSSRIKKAQQELIQSILENGSKAFHPASSPSPDAEALRAFDDLIQRTPTISVMSALNILIRPNSTPPWLRSRLMDILTSLPLRPDGVRGTLEFVFAVHPSSTVGTSEAAAPQKQGANITHEALSMASRLLSTPPSSVPAESWLSGISPQLLGLLDGKSGADLAKVAAYVIGFGVLGRRDLGAPGSPGWKWLAGPLLSPLCPSLGCDNGGSSSSDHAAEDSDEIIDLSRKRVLVAADSMVQAIQRLRSLIVSHPNPGLCKRLLRPILLPLWAFSSWPDPGERLRKDFCHPAKELLEVYTKLVASASPFQIIAQHLMYNGDDAEADPSWAYEPTADGMLHVVSARSLGGNGPTRGVPLPDIDSKAAILLDLLKETASDFDTSSVFLDLFEKWLEAGRRPDMGGTLIREENMGEEVDLLKQVAEVRLLQKMMERLPEKLVSRSDHALELACQMLKSPGSAPADDESLPITLSILNLVLTAPGFRKAKADVEVVASLQTSLDRIAAEGNRDVSSTARNLSLLLRYRDEAEELAGDAPDYTNRQIEERKTYSLAIAYITQTDSPPPVRSEGLNLISTLISAHSAILDIPAILVLMSSLLADSEDYVNLRVINIFTQLADKHPKSVTRELVDHLVDAKEMAAVDTRLRFAEALAQVTERLGETFAGGVAQQVGEALLATAGRRGRRRKTEARQAKEEKLRRKKHREAEEAWGGEVPDLSEDVTEAEGVDSEVLAKILDGWESRRGAEDVRIRTSALSVFATAVDTNIAGLGSALVSSAVDLCVDILTMELEMEKAIVRRAAAVLILSFVKALDQARQTGKRLGFGLTSQSREDILRILTYIGDADSDELVRQHAKDVVESLQNWELAAMLPVGPVQDTTLTRLAGLSVNLEQQADPGPGSRPRIEEIE